MNLKEQGSNASNLFSGTSFSRPAELLYKESSKLFAEILQKYKQVKDKEYIIADLGSHRGNFLKDVVGLLPGYRFKTIAIDVNVDDLEYNSADVKIVSDLNDLKLDDKSIDITLARYVLAWNDLNKQKEILAEIKRVTKGIAIVQHQGAKEIDGEILQNASKELFSGIVPALKRESFHFSTANEIESILDSLDIQFERVQYRDVEALSELLIEKYSLNEDDRQKVINILKDSDYVTQICWILKFE